MQTMNIHVLIDINLSTQFKEDSYKTECLAVLAWSLQYADCALIQFKDFWQKKKKKKLIQPVAIPTGTVSE